jgi:hypothetical protein
MLCVCAASLVVAACGWNPSKPFEREAPPVKQAISLLDGGDATAAATTLEEYLSTGPCAEGSIGVPDILKKRPDGTFDLGLSLFKVGESFGGRFGDEESAESKDEAALSRRRLQVDCALRIVRAIASDETQSVELRARAHYLEGNLEFLAGEYEEAVHAYDEALVLAPAENDAGDPVGRDAAWNRAIALRRIEDKKDAGQDASNDASNDATKDSPNDASKDAPSESGGKDGGKDGGNDGGGGSDAGKDSGAPDAGQDAEPQAPPPQQDQPDAAPPPPPRANQDDRILDQLENAPTVQQEQLRRMGPRRRVRGMQDK